MSRKEHKSKLQVLYQDNHIIIVNKPAGVLVHGDATGDKSLDEIVKEYIQIKYKKPGAVFLGVVHRLDRPVSGVIVFARTSKALARLNEMFKQRKVRKIYHAITRQRPPELEGNLTHYLLKNPQNNTVKAFNKEKGGAKKAQLSYNFIGQLNGHVLLQIEPHTGRPHQIRAQLKAMNCPIVGDLKYGFSQPNHDKSICLHARELSFIHPVSKKEIIARAPYPKLATWDLFR